MMMSGGIDYNGRHNSDACTMHWKICYVHRQSGRTLFVDTICHMAAGHLATAVVCSGKNLRTNIDTETLRLELSK